MRKIITLTLLVVMLLGVSVVSNAATSKEIVDHARNTGYLSASDIVKLERHLDQYPMTAADGDAFIAKIDDIKNVMDNAGVTDISKLSAADKDKVTKLANEAATIAGVTLSINDTNNTIKIYKDGKLIETLTITEDGKLAYTGNSVNVYVAISSLIALVAIVIFVRKGLVNNAK